MSNANEVLIRTIKKVFNNTFLTQCYFRYNYSFTNETLKNVHIPDIKDFIKRECSLAFSNFIIKHKSVKDIDFIPRKGTEQLFDYELELLVIKRSELKLLVKACIKDMDLNDIYAIKTDPNE